MTPRPSSLAWAALPLLAAAPVAAQQQTYERADPVRDAELARMTGKFVLPNGAELALSVVSDAAVNGQPVLRTVFTVDRSADLKVYARPVGAADGPVIAGAVQSAARSATTPAAPAAGVAVEFDRETGARFVGTAAAAPAVAVTATPVAARDDAADAAARGLSQVTPVAGGPAVATADGAVTLSQLPNGTAVALAGDRYGILQLAGRSIASAAVNSANDRMLDQVTDVAVDVRNVQPYAMGSAMMRADALALDATARLAR